MTAADIANAAWALRRARELARRGYPPAPRSGRAARRSAPPAAPGAVMARFARAAASPARPAVSAPAPRGQALLPLEGPSGRVA